MLPAVLTAVVIRSRSPRACRANRSTSENLAGPHCFSSTPRDCVAGLDAVRCGYTSEPDDRPSRFEIATITAWCRSPDVAGVEAGTHLAVDATGRPASITAAASSTKVDPRRPRGYEQLASAQFAPAGMRVTLEGPPTSISTSSSIPSRCNARHPEDGRVAQAGKVHGLSRRVRRGVEQASAALPHRYRTS